MKQEEKDFKRRKLSRFGYVCLHDTLQKSILPLMVEDGRGDEDRDSVDFGRTVLHDFCACSYWK